MSSGDRVHRVVLTKVDDRSGPHGLGSQRTITSAKGWESERVARRRALRILEREMGERRECWRLVALPAAAG